MTAHNALYLIQIKRVIEMMGRTHMIGGVLSGMAVITIGSIKDPVLIGTGMTCSILGSLLPDIDHPNAKVSRMNALFHAISRGVCSITSHRRFCHTLCFLALIGIGWILLFGLLGREVGKQVDHVLQQASHSTGMPLFTYISNIEIAPYIMMGCVFLLVGCLSHLILDTLNPEGVMWLYPFSKKRISLMSIRTNSAGETIANFVLTLMVILWVVILAWIRGMFDVI